VGCRYNLRSPASRQEDKTLAWVSGSGWRLKKVSQKEIPWAPVLP